MNEPAERAAQPALAPSLETLDRLEELLELMDELGVTTRAEAEALLTSLEASIDDAAS